MKPRLGIERTDFAVDECIPVRLENLVPGTEVRFEALLVDDENTGWRSWADFAAERDGVIDINRTAPVRGSWNGAEADGFLWSMAPCAPEAFDQFRLSGATELPSGVPSSHRIGRPTLLGDRPMSLVLNVQQEGRTTATTRITRHRFPPQVRETVLAHERLVGSLFEPASGPPAPGVLVLSGSEGGVKREMAALLAAHGFAALALGYFAAPRLPSELVKIPLEYFAEGIDWLADHLGHDLIGLIGGSRGGEGVLAIATAFPHRVKAVVADCPGDLYMGSLSVGGTVEPAWTLAGENLPVGWGEQIPDLGELVARGGRVDTRRELFGFYDRADIYERAAIPIENMQCPVLFVSGADDRVWPAHLASLRAVDRLRKCAYGWPVEHVWEADAGHLVGIPGYPTVMADAGVHPLVPLFLESGGSARGNGRVQRRGWDRTIAFLNEHLRGSSGVYG